MTQLVNRTKEMNVRVLEIGATRGAFLKDLRVRKHDEWLQSGGCTECGGHGTVVTWSTLDGPSYTEYGSCSNESCTAGTLGVDPAWTREGNLDWRRQNPGRDAMLTDVDDRVRLRELDQLFGEAEIALADERKRWELTKGKLVRVVRKSRTKGSPLPGVEGVVFWSGCNDWGTHKVGIRTQAGEKVWTTGKSVQVIDPEPDSSWDPPAEAGVPVIATIKARSSKAALLQLTDSRELWLPFSQSPSLSTCKKGQTLSVILPVWLAKKKGLVE